MPSIIWIHFCSSAMNLLTAARVGVSEKIAREDHLRMRSVGSVTHTQGKAEMACLVQFTSWRCDNGRFERTILSLAARNVYLMNCSISVFNASEGLINQ